MLASVSLLTPARSVGVVLRQASILGVEAEVGAVTDSGAYITVEGKTEKALSAALGTGSQVLDVITSVPGEPEGFGLASDLVNGRNVYADLVGKPIYKV